MAAPRRARRTAREPSLARALAYRNDQILYKFMERWEVSFAEAEELFTETKRLLWLMDLSRRRGRKFVLHQPLTILDEMWHTFVLFTREYDTYCRRVFGEFLHHSPTTKADKDRMSERAQRDPDRFASQRSRRDIRQWELIDGTLGEEILLKWYVDLPLRFNDRFFKKRAIPIRMRWRPSRSLVQKARART